MKELTTNSIQIIQQSLRTAEHVLTGGAVSKRAHINSCDALDTCNELDSIRTAETADAVSKVTEMVMDLNLISFMARRGRLRPASVTSKMYVYKLAEYQAAVRCLGIPVGGENQ